MSKFFKDMEWGNKQLDRAINLLKNKYPETDIIPTIKGGETDREFGGDLKVKFKDRQEIWAVKFRRLNYKKYSDITIEYRNGDGSFGDWFKFKGGGIKKYIYGYANGDIEFWIIDVEKLILIPEENFTLPISNTLHGSSKFKAIDIGIAIKFGVIDDYICSTNETN